ncbi:MAG: DNA cytosine methyltransferase, partial [Proteobacteria bacterium]|nr:DNA cytosine methyltransferase [Pseudomonadota bacterium]
DPRYFIHPEQDRGFTVREAARIQGFPDSFIFHGTDKEQCKLIGNAVPPPFAKWLAEKIKQLIL